MKVKNLSSARQRVGVECGGVEEKLPVTGIWPHGGSARKRPAFSLIELIFAIIVLGILGSVAMGKFGSTLQKREQLRLEDDVRAITTAVAKFHARLVYVPNSALATLGAPNRYPQGLCRGAGAGLTFTICGKDAPAFSAIFRNPPKRWKSLGGNKFSYPLSAGNLTFTYDPLTGKFAGPSNCARSVVGDGLAEICNKFKI